MQTGGGKLTPAETRAIKNPQFLEIVTKMGISARGNEPRHDSDALSQSIINPPTARLKRALRMTPTINYDETTRMSMSTESLASAASIGSVAAASPHDGDYAQRSDDQESEADEPPQKRQRRTKYATEFRTLFKQQEKNHELQKEYIELCIERAKVAKNTEDLRLKKAEIELKTAEECMRIEIDKQKKLAELELEAKRRELGL